ncbi:MAG: TetR/AcrR family transcriptional regulator [Candidatus Nanopelagicales bacterium]|nr:TetR/AcrR family transcriptional regulator [Candidatus Nanopelagicales bacterium]
MGPVSHLSTGNRRVSASDDPVLRAAYEGVLEIGLGRLTLAEVARRAGVSRMTVYRRYDDLDRLISVLLVIEFSAVIAEAAERARREPTGRGRLVREVIHVTRRTAEHPLMRRILELDPEMLMPLVVDRLGSSHRIGLDRLRQLLADGQADGSVAAGDLEAMSLQVMSMAASHVFSARAYDSVDPRGRRWPELERALDGYLRPVPAHDIGGTR